MRIHIEEDIQTDFGSTTFDIHIYDCEPTEYDALREMLNHYLRSKFASETDNRTAAPRCE